MKVGGELVLATPKTCKGFGAVVISPDALEVLRLHREQQDAERARLGSA